MAFFRSVTVATLFVFAHCDDLSYSITEEVPINTYIGNINSDASINDVTNTTSFQILPNASSRMFRIDSTSGRLFTSDVIDRESVCTNLTSLCVIRIHVFAFNKTFSKVFEVSIHVLDINDNIPTFPQPSIVINISESSPLGTTLTIPSAVDQDEETNGITSYKIIDSRMCAFQIRLKTNIALNNYNLGLVLAKPLDREERASYRCDIKAEDSGIPRRSGILKVNITVLDVNDNPPVFSENNYSVTINAAVPVGSDVLRVIATDKDIGLNGKIIYNFSSALTNQSVLDYFSINQVTGTLQIHSSLKTQNGKSFRMVVEANDLGSPMLTSTAVVIVNVEPSQIATPLEVKIEAESNPLHISESAAVGSLVTVVKVNDQTHPNGQVDCNINSSFFKLHRLRNSNFNMVLFKHLDREVQISHTVTVICRNLVSLQESSVTFNIDVLDENDNSPIFTRRVYNYRVHENTAIGTVIGQVKALDGDVDENGVVRYMLLNNNETRFTIDSLTGTIKVTAFLDREITTMVELYIVAIDQGSPSLTGSSTVIIQVTDVNDNSPQFISESFRFQVREDSAMGTFVGVVKATDRDEGQNGQVSFSLLSNDTSFTITPIGEIYTARILDREATHQYVFSVIASDHGTPKLSTVTKVTIDVQDVNDNRPIFMYPQSSNTTVTLPCDIQPNVTIATVIASDADSGENGEVRYIIRDVTQSLFKIDSVSGRITTFRRVSAQDLGRHNLSLEAKDRGLPPLTSEQNINIIIQSNAKTPGQSCFIGEIVG